MSLGAKLAIALKEYRERRGISQEALAKILNLSRATVNRWEGSEDAGSIRLEELESVLKKTDIKLTELFEQDRKATLPDSSLERFLIVLKTVSSLDEEKLGSLLRSLESILPKLADLPGEQKVGTNPKHRKV